MFRHLRPYQIVVDAGIAVLFAMIALPLELWTVNYEQVSAWQVAAMVIPLTGALAIRRLSPGLSLAVAWLGAIVQMLLLIGPRPTDVAIFAVLYATAAYGSRRVFWWGFASAVGGSLVITVYLFTVVSSVDITDLADLSIALVVLAAALFALGLSWVSGALVRTVLRGRETQLARGLAEAQAAAEQERVRIARDMHDVVAHSLTVVIAQADGARYAAASDPTAASTALGTISTTARAALADVRLLLTQLRHSEGPGPQPTLADVEGLYARVRAAGVELRVDVDPAPSGEAPASVQLAVYRILQEALTNALRHGDGGTVSVRLAWLPTRVEVVVSNGRSAAPAPGGHGLVGMRERAQLVGGRLDAGAEGADFVVRATIPVAVAE
ncbi:sensor histidine kinase [Microbacterium sp. P06]|uniref:sensor histidine kinase n=1 Tax=Microbacterium sp. P06 TaxID=3366949 RepID=UPI0037463847